MPINTSNVQAFTLAEHLAMVENAIANLMMGGQSYTISGRVFLRADLDKLRAWRAELLGEVNDSANAETGGGIALARFNETS